MATWLGGGLPGSLPRAWETMNISEVWPNVLTPTWVTKWLMTLPHKKQGDIWKPSTVEFTPDPPWIKGKVEFIGFESPASWSAVCLLPEGNQVIWDCLQVQTQHYTFCTDTHHFLSLFSRINLYELMKNNSFQGFNLSVVRRFTLSVLKCLQMLYVEKIIHCDLKPVSTSSVLTGELVPTLRNCLPHSVSRW